MQPLLLVDFENVQAIDVELVPSDYRIAIFCGANQKSASLDLTSRLQPLGSVAELADYRKHVNGHVLYVRPSLLLHPTVVDVTEMLRDAYPAQHALSTTDSASAS